MHGPLYDLDCLHDQLFLLLELLWWMDLVSLKIEFQEGFHFEDQRMDASLRIFEDHMVRLLEHQEFLSRRYRLGILICGMLSFRA